MRENQNVEISRRVSKTIDPYSSYPANHFVFKDVFIVCFSSWTLVPRFYIALSNSSTVLLFPCPLLSAYTAVSSCGDGFAHRPGLGTTVYFGRSLGSRSKLFVSSRHGMQKG